MKKSKGLKMVFKQNKISFLVMFNKFWFKSKFDLNIEAKNNIYSESIILKLYLTTKKCRTKQKIKHNKIIIAKAK